MKNLIVILCLPIILLFGSEVNGSELPPCKHTIYESQTLFWDKCVGSWEYTSTNTNKRLLYKGEWKDGKRSGHGVLTIIPLTKFGEEKYIGEFSEGKRTGQGTYIFANGDKYVGDFIDGEKIGRGTYTFANGDKYIGEFKDDRMHGDGTYRFQGGKVFNGVFKEGNFLMKK